MFQESVTLVLKHADISTDTTLASVSNSIGSWSNGKQKTSWRVNLRNLLGDQFRDNDLFTLRLNQVAYAQANFPNDVIDQQVIVNISGLRFKNSTYSVSSGNNTQTNQLLILNIATTGATVDYSPNIAMCNFTISGEYVTITIELLRTIDNQPPQYNLATFPHMVYNFDIYAVNAVNK
jgi:hypothetical protein